MRSQGPGGQIRRVNGGAVMFMILFILLTVAWLLGSTLFHVSSLFIHILLSMGVVSLIMHFVRGQGART